jgi:hypothetical protein
MFLKLSKIPVLGGFFILETKKQFIYALYLKLQVFSFCGCLMASCCM